MKNLIFICLSILLTLFIFDAKAQKFAFVDSDYILESIPEYADAQAQLDENSLQWQKEVDNAIAEVEILYKDFRAEALLLPADIKEKKQNEILEKEKGVRDLQQKYFGPSGDLIKLREELVKPIQDKIFLAIEAVSTTRRLGMVFDKAGAVTIMYADVKHDISDDVLAELGYSFNAKSRK